VRIKGLHMETRSGDVGGLGDGPQERQIDQKNQSNDGQGQDLSNSHFQTPSALADRLNIPEIWSLRHNHRNAYQENGPRIGLRCIMLATCCTISTYDVPSSTRSKCGTSNASRVFWRRKLRIPTARLLPVSSLLRRRSAVDRTSVGAGAILRMKQQT